MSNRQLHKKKYGVQHLWGPNAMRRIAEDEKWEEPLYWNRVAEKRNSRAQVFCGSMCDVMEDRRDLDAPRQRLYQLIEQTPFLDWLLVTKRPEQFSKFLPQSWRSNPKPNVWLMTTCENQECADKRIPELMKVPAVALHVPDVPKNRLNSWIRSGRESSWGISVWSKAWPPPATPRQPAQNALGAFASAQ
jgi:protein gp37